jgi:hypothetical protein
MHRDNCILCIRVSICMLYELQMHPHTSMHMFAVCASDTNTFALAQSLMLVQDGNTLPLHTAASSQAD